MSTPSLPSSRVTLSRSIHEIEFRDASGLDVIMRVDVWADTGRQRAVIVLRDLPEAHEELLMRARLALHILLTEWLPYLLRPEADVLVLALRPRLDDAKKARAVVLPLSA